MRYQISNFEYLKQRLEGIVFDPLKDWREYPFMIWDRGTSVTEHCGRVRNKCPLRL